MTWTCGQLDNNDKCSFSLLSLWPAPIRDGKKTGTTSQTLGLCQIESNSSNVLHLMWVGMFSIWAKSVGTCLMHVQTWRIMWLELQGKNSQIAAFLSHKKLLSSAETHVNHKEKFQFVWTNAPSLEFGWWCLIGTSAGCLASFKKLTSNNFIQQHAGQWVACRMKFTRLVVALLLYLFVSPLHGQLSSTNLKSKPVCLRQLSIAARMKMELISIGLTLTLLLPSFVLSCTGLRDWCASIRVMQSIGCQPTQLQNSTARRSISGCTSLWLPVWHWWLSILIIANEDIRPLVVPMTNAQACWEAVAVDDVTTACILISKTCCQGQPGGPTWFACSRLRVSLRLRVSSRLRVKHLSAAGATATVPQCS